MHMWEIKRGKGCGFHREASALGIDSFIFAIVETCSADVRFERERHYIDTLCAVVPDGFNIKKDPTKGANAHDWSKDRRAANSARAKARMSTVEARAAASLRGKAQFASVESRDKAAAWAKKRWENPAERAAQSIRSKEFNSRPESKAAASARGSAQFKSIESRVILSEMNKARFESKEARIKQSERMIKWHASRRDARLRSVLFTTEAEPEKEESAK